MVLSITIINMLSIVCMDLFTIQDVVKYGSSFFTIKCFHISVLEVQLKIVWSKFNSTAYYNMSLKLLPLSENGTFII